MQAPPFSIVFTPSTTSTVSTTSTSTNALTASSSVSTASFTPASPAEHPSTQPPTGLWHAMCQLFKRNQLGASGPGDASGRALTDRSPRLPHQAVSGDHKRDTRTTKDAKPATPTHPRALADIWPDHVFADGPAKALCQTLLALRGNWNGALLSKQMVKLNDDALAEVGEFAAYLQAHPSNAETRILMHVLVELTTPVRPYPCTPEQEAAADATGRRLRHLARGIARGLTLSGQVNGLQQFFARLREIRSPVFFDGLGHLVVHFNERLSDEHLERVMIELAGLNVRYTDGLPYQLHQLAREPRTSPEALHRLARTATAGYLQVGNHPLQRWLGVLEAPDDDKAALSPERQFVLGHGVGAGCRARAAARSAWLTQNIEDVSYFVDGKHHPSRPTSTLSLDDLHTRAPLPKPTAASRAGALWGLDPLGCVGRLPHDPDCGGHVDTWIALKAPMNDIDPVAWYRTVENINIAFAQRHRLQRLMLGRGENFGIVRASLLPPAGGEVDDEIAAAIGRLTDLYRYFGEREGLEFAFGDAADVARIRQEATRVRERIATIEQAIRELQALAPDASGPETATHAFLREGLAQVARVTLGRSLQALQANQALALGEASSSQTTRSPKTQPDGQAVKDGKGD